MNDTRSFFAHIRSEIETALERSGAKTAVVGLGGAESWLVTVAAADVLGASSVLGVSVYSIQTDSVLPWTMESLARGMSIDHCSIDATRTLMEMLDARIDIGGVGVEALHRTMSPLLKAEVMAGVRDGFVRAIASRHSSLYLGAISGSKIAARWGIPASHGFDWNPLSNCDHRQVLLALAGRRMADEDILDSSRLDLLPDGGPVADSEGPEIDFCGNPFCNNISPRFGLGVLQDAASAGDD